MRNALRKISHLIQFMPQENNFHPYEQLATNLLSWYR